MRLRPLVLTLTAALVACANPADPQEDAGLERDAGAERDAGPERDAGAEIDAGIVDAGTIDGGVRDAGDAPRDGGPGPVQTTWVSAGSSTPRLRHTASLLPDGRVLLVGGQSDDEGAASALSSVEIFDPADHSYTPAASLPEPRFQHLATTLADGRILITGGSDGNPLYDGLIFDPSTETWSPAYDFATTRRGYAQTLLDDGTVLLTAGYGTSSFTGATTEQFDPTTNTFTRLMTVDLVEPRGLHASFTLDDGRVVVIAGSGGVNQPNQRNTAEIYDPSSSGSSFEIVTSTMAFARGWPIAEKLPDGRILVTGQQTMSIADAEVFDPDGDVFVTVGPMVRRRLHHRLTAITAGPFAGRALVTGGSEDARILTACDLFDPTTDTFAATAAMTTSRNYHTATALPDGRVFVFGGINNFGPVSNGEIFVPVP